MTSLFDSNPVSHLRETALIEKIRQWLGESKPKDAYGLHDDCAVFGDAKLNLGTVDSLIYGKHFDDQATPEQVGAKLVNRNLSDIAAMGGVPKQALLALFLAPNVSTDWLEKFFAGMKTAADRFDLTIAGGDIAEAPKGQFQASLSVLGYAEKPVSRSGAKEGDCIYVTGTLGGSILGRHLTFTPRIHEGQWLLANGARAMIDISDGLAKDLPAIIPEALSTAIDTDKIPLADAAKTMAKKSGKEAIEHAFCDGEDYELLFTHPDADLQKKWAAQFDLPLTCIGKVTTKSKAKVINQNGESIPWTHGYEHL